VFSFWQKSTFRQLAILLRQEGQEKGVKEKNISGAERKIP